MDVTAPLACVVAGSPQTAADPRPAARALREILIGFVLVLLALWSAGRLQWLLGGAAFAYVFFVTLRSHPTAEQLGLRVSGMRRALWIVALAGIAAVLGVWLSVRLGTFHAVFRNYAVEWGFLAYIGWALVQQFILQDFILARLLQITPKRTLAVIVAGLLFAVAHVPNPLLVIATIVWGIVACALFLRYRNLYVLGLAHAILGMCIAVAVPNQWHHHMRVGLGYLRWHHPSTAHKQQIVPFAPTISWFGRSRPSLEHQPHNNTDHWPLALVTDHWF
ncbi:MAG TPA: CPBP family intramembrane glutamic endopeptidase [Terriglobales bacterium]|nr:CPBP family intramembrane glutamic endopeptidase [Terriglobales bacterium]